MRVSIKDNVYGMSRREYKKLLNIASNAIPNGIYAIEKGNIAVMTNEKHKNTNGLKQAITEYKMKGFKVYYNEKDNTTKVS